MPSLREVMRMRHSVRRYRPEPVPDSLIEEIASVADTAPSAGGLKARQALIVRQKITRYNAPVNLVICALPEKSAKKYGNRGRRLYAIQDATIFGAYAQLAACDLGLDSVWVGAFREGRLRRTLGLPEEWRPIAIICLGYGMKGGR